MIQTYHHGRFEFFVAVIVIAIVSLAALGRYSLMAEDARILRLEIISHHFITGAANMRVQFLVANVSGAADRQKPFQVSGKQIYFSQQGWPVSSETLVADNYQPTDEDCYQLWQLLLQNPAPIAKGATVISRKEYRTFAQTNYCRYQFNKGAAYFDYVPLDGSVSFISGANP